jgi:isoleucyl-tRNA synthetase
MEKNDFQKKALETIEQVEWIPHWGKDRILGMVGNRPDWCISRQRSWGVPIVAFYCKDCGEVLLSSEIINHVADLFEKESSDIWFSRDALELLPEGTKCSSCGKNDFEKETDILDVWFDSGVSHAAVLEKRDGLESPCDLYLEGSDQHRGWFQSSLLTSVGTRGRAPFKSVLTHGFVVDGKGRKMAKSEGNVIAPEKIIKQYGAEIIRLWVASEDYRDDMRISQDILQRLSEAYRKIRNTCRFILGNISDFDPSKDMVPLSDLEEIDRWALHRLNLLTEKVRGAYDKYEFHTVYHSITNFCITDMSAVYLDILKDRLYCSSPSEALRRTAQTTLYIILRDIVKLLAPVLSFTAEEVWSFIPGEKEESVHLALLPAVNQEFENKEVADRWEVVLKVRDSVLKILEEARVDKVIGNSLEASVKLEAPQKLYDFLSKYRERLADIFIVSHVELILNETMTDLSLEESADNISVSVSRAEGGKCERCWKYFTETQGSNQSVCGRCGEALKSYDAAE